MLLKTEGATLKWAGSRRDFIAAKFISPAVDSTFINETLSLQNLQRQQDRVGSPLNPACCQM